MPVRTNRQPGELIRAEDANDIARVANSAEARVQGVEEQVNGRLSETSLAGTFVPLSDYQQRATEAAQAALRDDPTIRDAAVAEMAEAAAQTEALASSFAPIGGATKGLDIWPEYDLRNLYTEVIAHADAALGTAGKSQIGTASDGTTPIYAYTAGNPAAPHALLVSGTHGHEVLPVGACHRWMEAFATSKHPAMVDLRSRLRVTWVPALNASQYRGTRANSNAVDINRNYAHNWTLFGGSAKGAAPFSEPETAAIKTLIDSTGIAFMLDAHNHGNEPSVGNVAISGPPAYVYGNREVAEAARKIVSEEYVAGTAHTVTDYQTSTIYSMSHPWAAQYLRWAKGRTNAGSALIEVSPDLAGSTPWLLTREAARLYCGAITAVFTEWLRIGQTIGAPKWADVYASRSDTLVSNRTIPIQDGGHLINSQTAHPITFDSGRNYIAVPILGPGRYALHYEINVVEAGGAGQVWAMAGLAPMPPTGDIARDSRSISYVTLGTGAVGSMTGFVAYDVSTVPDDTILMGQVFASVAAAGVAARIGSGNGLRAWVTYAPSGWDYPAATSIVRP